MDPASILPQETRAELDALPFEVLLWVAAADENVEPDEVEVFHKMLARRSWCRSALAQAVLPRTAEGYSALWQPFARKQRGRDLARVERGLRAAALAADEADFVLFKQDVAKLADSIARAAGGFLGLGAVNFHEQNALRELSALLERVRGAEPVAGGRVSVPGEAKPGAGAGAPLRWTQGRLELTCTDVVAETADARTFRFVADGAVHYDYQPGQFVTLELEIQGQKVLRSYSLSSSPSRQGALEITVKRVPGGLVSNWLHDAVQPGFKLAVRGPAGKFSCAGATAEKLLFLSAGSGITPVMSMSRWLHDTGANVDVVFVHSARSQDDVIFAREIALMAVANPRFRPVITLTRPDPARPWNGPTGRLTEEMLIERVPDYRRRTVYTCGPTPFMEHTREVLSALGFPMERYHMESFGGASGGERDGGRRKRALHSLSDLLPVPEAAPAGMAGMAVPKPSVAPTGGEGKASERERASASAVVFARSGREVAHDGETKLLELAEQLGISIPNACRSGVCGSCKAVVREGTVEMDCADGLSSGEREKGHVLCCVALPRGRVVVDA